MYILYVSIKFEKINRYFVNFYVISEWLTTSYWLMVNSFYASYWQKLQMANKKQAILKKLLVLPTRKKHT